MSYPPQSQPPGQQPGHPQNRMPQQMPPGQQHGQMPPGAPQGWPPQKPSGGGNGKQMLKMIGLPIAAVAGIVIVSQTGLLKKLSPSAEDAKERYEDTKSAYSNYVEAFNGRLSRIAGDLSKMLRKLPKAGPKPTKKYYVPNDKEEYYGHVIEELNWGIKKGDSDVADVKPHAETLVAQLQVLNDNLPELYRYYEQEAFKDDDGAKGVELWGKVQPAAVAYLQAMTEFNKSLSVAELKVMKKQLDKANKSTPQYAVRNYIYLALLVERSSELDKLEPLLVALEPAYAKVSELAKSSPKQKYGGSIMVTHSSIGKVVDSHFATAKKLLRKVQAGASAKDIKKANAKVSKDYQEMIEHLNRA